MNEVAFLIPGDLDLPTGAFGYDRSVLRKLPQHGVHAMHVALPGAFPEPSKQDLADCAAIIRSLPTSAILLIDSLAYSAMPSEMIRSFGRPIVAVCHHPLALENGISAIKAQALHLSETTALALADHIIVTSSLTARILEGDFTVPRDKITVAVPGTTRKVRAMGSGQGTLELLAVGSIVPRKGYGVLIEALAGLKQRNWRLRIAGAARALDTVNALQAQIEREGLTGRVQLMGALRDRDLDALYEKSDLFVMASLFEGYGMVLAEALQRGLPIVTTTGGAASLTVPDGAGLKVAPGDVDALRGALESALSDPALRSTLSDAAYEAGQKLPSWDDTTAIIAETLRPFMLRRKAS